MSEAKSEASALIAGLSSPSGYWVEFKPGDPALYSPEAFALEKFRWGGQIRALYLRPQQGCSQEPAAYRGRFWHQAKHYAYNRKIDPGATPMYIGPVLHDPVIDEPPFGAAG